MLCLQQSESLHTLHPLVTEFNLANETAIHDSQSKQRPLKRGVSHHVFLTPQSFEPGGLSYPSRWT